MSELFGTSRRQISRRQLPRRKVLWGARLTNLTGSRYLRCVARDISFTGARIDIGDNQFLDRSGYFLDVRNRIAYEAVIVWCRHPEMGLQFIRTYRFDEIPSATIGDHIRNEY